MTTIAEMLPGAWANAVGWMLVHSIWQGAIAAAITLALLRIIPTYESRVRYTAVCAGLLLFVVATVVTFNQLYDSNKKITHPRVAEAEIIEFRQVALTVEPREQNFLSAVTSSLEEHMDLVVLAWGIGFLIFSIRLAAGIFYTHRIISTSKIIKGTWEEFIQNAGRQMGLKRALRVAESARINTPMVIGFLKPVILVPVGMMSGLSTEQLETIFLHELAHVKRNDYIVNVLQSLLETIFFFNPFVWMLSKAIRREREYCCDDIVLNYHGGASAYAHALVRLAEARLTSPALALPLGTDKNQLLGRIRRIMERSIARHPVNKRLLFGLLLLGGAVLSISWIGIRPHGSADQSQAVTLQDSLPSKKSDEIRYSRRSIITIDKNGQPHEEIIENFEGDTSLRPLIRQHFRFPRMGSIDSWPPHKLDPADPGFMIPGYSDTIPWGRFRFQDEHFERLNKIFEDRFGDLFSGRHMDAERFMQEFEENFRWDEWRNHMPDLDSLRQSPEFENFDDLRKEFKDMFPRRFQDDLDGRPLQRYEDVLTNELRKDGYLSGNEAIESLQWSNDRFKVNGRSIKEEDIEKYNDINRRHLGSKPTARPE